jgi:hypothetical protein
VVNALNLGIQQTDLPARRGEGVIGIAEKLPMRDKNLGEETIIMGISRKAKAAAAAAAVGTSALIFGLGPVSAVPLDPPPSPAPGGPAMAPGTSPSPTSNISRPGVGPGGAHGGQNQTKAPGS